MRTEFAAWAQGREAIEHEMRTDDIPGLVLKNGLLGNQWLGEAPASAQRLPVKRER
jgi:hypothetical protein